MYLFLKYFNNYISIFPLVTLDILLCTVKNFILWKGWYASPDAKGIYWTNRAETPNADSAGHLHSSDIPFSAPCDNPVDFLSLH